MSSRVCLKNANIWTGNNSDSILEDWNIEIENDRISDLTPGGPTRAAITIDCANRWVMPGLIDAHMHFIGARSSNPVEWCIQSPVQSALYAVADARRMLEAGFTAARDAGSRVGPYLRDAIAEKELMGPRVVTSYLGITRTGGHVDAHSLPIEWVREQPYMGLIADGPDECRRAVRQIARAGANWIKVWATGGVVSERDNPRHSHMTPSELETIVEEAHSIDLKVGAHWEGLPATKASVKAGADFIEHGFHLDKEVCAVMAQKKIPVVTTLAFLHRTANWEGPGAPEYAGPKAREILTQAVDSLNLAYRMGVPIAMGTDTFAAPLTPFGKNAEELLYLRQAGLSPQDCLRAATQVAAGVLGLAEKIGSIEIGKQADLLLVGQESPLDDLSVLTDPHAIGLVMKAGEFVAGVDLKK